MVLPLRAVLPLIPSGTAALIGPCPQGVTTVGVGAVLPLGAVVPPLLPPLVPQNPTQKTSFSNRGGSSLEALWYYSRRPQAVLPLRERYYRLGAVLTLWERYYRWGASAVLPLWTAVLPLGQDKADTRGKVAPTKRKENIGCDMDVYVLIPP